MKKGRDTRLSSMPVIDQSGDLSSRIINQGSFKEGENETLQVFERDNVQIFNNLNDSANTE